MNNFYLKIFFRISRSRNDQIFENFVKKTDEKQRIDCIRKNILLQVAKSEKPDNLCLVSKQYQRYIKAEQLKRKIQQAKKQNEVARQKEKALLTEIQNSSKLKHNDDYE